MATRSSKELLNNKIYTIDPSGTKHNFIPRDVWEIYFCLLLSQKQLPEVNRGVLKIIINFRRKTFNKKGVRNSRDNCRPVSKLRNVSKILSYVFFVNNGTLEIIFLS